MGILMYLGVWGEGQAEKSIMTMGRTIRHTVLGAVLFELESPITGRIKIIMVFFMLLQFVVLNFGSWMVEREAVCCEVRELSSRRE